MMDSTLSTEKSKLLGQHNKASFWFKLKKRFSNALVTSPVAILGLVWVWIGGNLLILTENACWSTYEAKVGSTCSLSSCFTYVPLAFICLFIVFGYLGEKYKRYYVLMSGVVIVSCSTIFVIVFVVIAHVTNVLVNHHALVNIFLLFNISILFLGYGLFCSNSIQFIIHQLPDASSEQLATLIRWWIFMFFAGISGIPPIQYRLEDWIIPMIILLGFTMVFLFIGICFKRYFIIEPPPSVDPLKLIYNVLKYGYTHKYPERRSAFTYNDNPSRLDYGKTRYGGPFTTDQVESVKSFWYILAVLMPSTLFSYFTMNEVVSNLSVTQLNESFHDNAAEAGLRYTDSSYIIIIGIPLIQFIVKPFFPKVKLSMLKCLWIGLFLMTISYLAITIIIHFVSISVFMKASIGLTLINNIGSAILSITSLEFIVAQSPSNMQGLLLGVYYLLFMADLIPVVVFVPLHVSSFLFLCIATSLLCVSFIVYNLAMYCYKYRLRNELSDVNRRQAVEDIYERRLAIDNIQDEDDDEDILSLYSNTVQSHI